jgi:hypothetical protein
LIAKEFVVPLKIIKQFVEFEPRQRVTAVPNHRRGLYVLYNHVGGKHYDVVYVGKGLDGIKVRLNSHKSGTKQWTHFSAFEVQDAITDDDIKELEGLFRHVYRRDRNAAKSNKQRSFGRLLRVHKELEDWV